MGQGLEQGILWILSVMAALFVGGFLKSYMGRKGENLATHEDIQKLVDQVRAVTAATEEIKAQISNEQREWNLKRDVLFEAVKDITALHHSASKVAALTSIHARNPDAEWVERQRQKANEEVTAAIGEFWKAHTLVTIACGPEVTNGFGKVRDAVETLGRLRANDNEQILVHTREINVLLNDLAGLIRKDLLTK
jgi:hypothetical protein